MSTIPYGRQEIDQEDIDAVIAVLRSDFITQGPVVPAFEEAAAAYCGARHAVAVNSATSALHIACAALGVGPGDWVWTSPITFVASANCALYCGASVDFVDIDPRTYNLSVARLAEKLEVAAGTGRLPKVVIPVHFCGQSCDMAGIAELGRRYGFKVIEDASHAIGGSYDGAPIGDCRFSDVAVFSFHPVKIVTTGEGGMAVTNDSSVAGKMRLLRSHGITNRAADMLDRPTNEIWNYQQVCLGLNYRMTDIHAALGLSQFSKLERFVRSRREIALRYGDMLRGQPAILPWQHPDCESSWHLYVVRLNLNAITGSQKQVHEAMREAGILVNLHYIPVYRQPHFERMGFASGHCIEAEAYFREAISLPMYPALTVDEQRRVVSTLVSALSG